MPSIPLGLQSYSRPSGFQPEVRLLNMFIEKDESAASPDLVMRLQRPGLAPYVTLPSAIRGMFRKDGIAGDLPLIAAGTTLYKTDGATNTSLGTLADDGDTVSFAAGNFGAGIQSAGTFYLYDNSTLVSIALPNELPIIDVESINSYFILPQQDGRFYWLVPGATEVDALDFATAESSPDGLVAVRRLNDELYFFGSSTLEVWQTTGNADAPFQRAAGRQFDKGCVSRDTVYNYDNTLVWVGTDNIVYRLASVPERISTFGIEERLRKSTSTPSAFTFLHDGHLFYCLRVPGQGTFAYDAAMQAWSEFGTYGATTWRPHQATQLGNGKTLCGDSMTGDVWLLDPDRSNDAGTPIERLVTGSIAFVGRPVRNDSFTLGVGCSADCDFRLRWHDGQTSFPSAYETLSATAPVDLVSIFCLGAAEQPVRTFEVSCVADAKVRISGAMLNQAWK